MFYTCEAAVVCGGQKKSSCGEMDLLLAVFNPCTGTVVRLIADEQRKGIRKDWVSQSCNILKPNLFFFLKLNYKDRVRI